MVKLNWFFCLFRYHAILLVRIIEARLHAILISVIEGMNGSFMLLTLGRKCVGTHRTGGRVVHITGLDLVQKKDLPVLLKNEARFVSVSSHILTNIPKV
jgi:hypothetical protein